MTVPMAMLAFLSESPEHGFSLKQRYDAVLGQERELKAAQVYSTLARLERDGLCRGVGFEKGNAADKKVYAITEDGVSAVQDWIRQPSLPSGRPGELLTKVVLALVAGVDPAEILDSHRALYLERMRALTQQRRTGDGITRLAADYDLRHLQADLDWIEAAGERLDELQGRA